MSHLSFIRSRAIREHVSSWTTYVCISPVSIIYIAIHAFRGQQHIRTRSADSMATHFRSLIRNKVANRAENQEL
jgi:hypothetical protein